MAEGKLVSAVTLAEDFRQLTAPTPAELAALQALAPGRLRDLDFR